MGGGDLNTILIDSIEDPRVEPFRNQRDAWLRAAHNPDRIAAPGGGADSVGDPDAGGLFMAEGILVVEQLVRSRFGVHSVLLTPERLRSHAALLTGLPAGTPIYVAAPEVMNAIVGFKIHRGMLAAGRRGRVRTRTETLADARLCVVMEDLANHDNVGGIFRSVGALAGSAGAVLLNDRTCDPFYRKALRVSIGQVLRVPWASVGEEIAPALAALRDAGWIVAALATDADAVSLEGFVRALEPGARIALVVGAEGPGLTERARSAADRRVRIPMDPAVDSLNVTVAASIALASLSARLGVLAE